MKKRTKLLMLAVTIFPFFVACNKHEQQSDNKEHLIWDFAPYVIWMEVTDSEGNNLFESSTKGNWLNGPVSAVFKGIEYTFPSDNEEDSPETKELLVPITGLSVSKYVTLSISKTCLVFGELNGGDNLKEDLSLTWPDGTADVITIHHTVTFSSGNPSVKTAHFLNGKAVTAPVLLVKTPLNPAD